MKEKIKPLMIVWQLRGRRPHRGPFKVRRATELLLVYMSTMIIDFVALMPR
jgi:hypothetical protein